METMDTATEPVIVACNSGRECMGTYCETLSSLPIKPDDTKCENTKLTLNCIDISEVSSTKMLTREINQDSTLHIQSLQYTTAPETTNRDPDESKHTSIKGSCEQFVQSPEMKSSLFSLQPDWLLQQKLIALIAENRILKGMLWNKRTSKKGHTDKDHTEALCVAEDLVSDLITKSVFLSETQTTTTEVSHYLHLNAPCHALLPRRRGRPPKKKPCVVNGALTQVSLGNEDKNTKRKNPHPRKCTLRPNNGNSLENTEQRPLPPRKQKLIAQSKVMKIEKESQAALTDAIKPDVNHVHSELSASDNDGFSENGDSVAADTSGEIKTPEWTNSVAHYKSMRHPVVVTRTRRGKHRKIVRHKCKLCNTTFTHGRPFKRHLSGYPRGSCCCKLCHKEFISAAIFLHHDCEAKRRVKGLQRNCKHCSESFTNLKKYIAHLKGVHQERVGEPECFCKYCNKGFIKRATMYKHYITHASPGHTVCSKCGDFVVDSEDALNQHNKYHVDNANHICDKCGATFMRKQQYEQHMAAHARYGCPICNGCYSTRKALEKHQRITHGIKVDYEHKKYYCDQCGKCFARPGLLEIHTRVHTGK